MKHSRRNFLKAAGVTATAGATAVLVGDALAGNYLEFKLFQTKGVETQSRINADDPAHALKVAKDYTKYSFGNLVDDFGAFDGVRVAIEREAQQLDTDYFNSVLRVVEWEERVDNMNDRAEHGNLLIDTGYFSTIGGIAFNLNLINIDCDMRTDDSSAALINGGEYLTHVPRNDAAPSHLLSKNDDPAGDDDKALGRYYAGAAVHELGHLACAPHSGGNSWTGADVPNRHVTGYHIADDNVISSIMMGLYAMKPVEKPYNMLGTPVNLCEEEIEPIDVYIDRVAGEIVLLDDWHQSYHFSDCNKERIANAYHNARNR